VADTRQNALALPWLKWAQFSWNLAQQASTEFEREQRMLDYQRGIARAKEAESADHC
jgi:hypothetical protein